MSDLIDRQAIRFGGGMGMKAVNVDDVLKILHSYGSFIFVTDEQKYTDMEYKIANLPSVTPTERTGHWIVSPNGMFANCSYCSHHEEKEITDRWKYCPNCGAKMKSINK